MQDSNRFYVYEHTRPDTGGIFYVGKGSGNRLNCTRPTHRNSRWKRIVAKAGGFTAKKLTGLVDEELAMLVEVERIDQLRRLGIQLCNMTLGGDGAAGYRHTEEAKRKMSVPWPAGREMSREQKELVANLSRSRVISEVTRTKMSLAHTGRTHSDESKLKMSIARTGKKVPPVSQRTRDLLSASNSGANHPMWGKHHSEESRRKISEAKRGRPGPSLGKKATAEARQRMSASNRAPVGVKQPSVECPHCGVTGGLWL